MRKKENVILAMLLSFVLLFSQQTAAFAAGETETAVPADGTYTIPAETDQRMFYLVSDEKNGRTAQLTVSDGQMQASFSLTGTGYDKAYMGKVEDAPDADASRISDYTVVDGNYTFTVPVSALDQPLDIAVHAIKSGNWYQHTITFYSSKEAKDKIENEQNPEEKSDSDKDKNTAGDVAGTESRPDKDVVKETDDNPKSGTQKITHKSGLADGVYKPDQFSWSGGSGRLAYIACDKITIKKGKAYATIRFSSSSYDKVRAGGSVYKNIGSAASTFTIPVKLNANNEISGRTVAMSSPHWVAYTIYPYLAEAGKASGGVTPNRKPKDKSDESGKLSAKDTEIIGLGEAEEIPMEHAKYCSLFRYENGVKLLQIQMNRDSILSYEAEKADQKEAVIYDEEGKPLARSQSEITQELYRSATISYLLIPEGVEVPAGLDKEMILVSVPAARTWSASAAAGRFLQALHCDTMLTIDAAADAEKEPDFKDIIQKEINFAILPSSLIRTQEGESAESLQEKQTQLEKLEKRFATLGIPVIMDRSADEPDLYAKAEWAKVYAAIFGAEAQTETAVAAMQDETFWNSLSAAAEDEKQETQPAQEHAQDTEHEAALPKAIAAIAGIAILAVAAVLIFKKKRK